MPKTMANFLKMDPSTIEKLFQSTQILLIVGIVIAVLLFSWMQSSRNQKFSKHSLDPSPDQKESVSIKKAEANIKQTLLLEGIRINGAPHEVLGVSPRASEKEIQKAYISLMKRFHPDRVGAQGTQPWKDAQKIAEAINRARQTMLQTNRSKRS